MEKNFKKTVLNSDNELTGEITISIDDLINGMGASHKSFPAMFNVKGQKYNETLKNITRTDNFKYEAETEDGVSIKIDASIDEHKKFTATVKLGEPKPEVEFSSDDFIADLKAQGRSEGTTNLTLAKLDHADGMVDRDMEATVADKKTGKKYKLTLSRVNTSGQREFTAILGRTADFCFTVLGDEQVEYEAVEA